jgi:hypothetical protein
VTSDGPARWPSGARGPGSLPPPWAFSGTGWSTGFHVVVAADENRDGRLTPEEMAHLVRKADTDGDGSNNSLDIDRLVMSRFQFPSQPSSPPGAWTNDRGRRDGLADIERGAASAGDERPSGDLDD